MWSSFRKIWPSWGSGTKEQLEKAALAAGHLLEAVGSNGRELALRLYTVAEAHAGREVPKELSVDDVPPQFFQLAGEIMLGMAAKK